MTFIKFAENVLGIELLDCYRAVLEKAQKCKDEGKDFYIYTGTRVGKTFLNNIIQQKLGYDRGFEDGARQFAEWFAEVSKVSEPIKEDTINRWFEDFVERQKGVEE